MARRAKSSTQLRHSDRAFLGRSSDPDDLEIVRSEGSFVFDAHGERYIDFVMGWCVGNLGWAPAEVHAAVERFRGPDYVEPSALYKPWVELASLLAAIAPGRLRKSFRATGGTEAVELALQAAQSFTGRKKFVAIADAYHGNSIGVKALGRRTIKPPLDGAALQRVERALQRRDVAAFIMEPVICNLGALAPDEEFMRGLGELCEEFGTLLIFDEVACGFGRTGRLFASEHFDVEPDIVCLAKAITAGVMPMGATIMTDEVADGLDDDFSFYSTYGWHPRSVAAAIANVKFWKRHGKAILANVVARAEEFEARLGAIDFGCAAEVRVKGLAIGIEFEDEGYAEKLQERCRKAGLLISADDDMAMLFPALTIDEKTVARGIDILEGCASS
ncbi:MAG: argD [Myxococcales bacterium]|nr:argD [Myxococcales bacterium]